jgi:hypothetical protein
VTSPNWSVTLTPPSPPLFFVTAHSKGVAGTHFCKCAF